MATTILNHALINHKLTIMRDKNTNNVVFKDNLDEICLLYTSFLLNGGKYEECIYNWI